MEIPFRRIICFLWIIFPYAVLAANIPFIPQVINYAVTDYKAGNQNWAVAQDSGGYIYFGNNRGLLQFDGREWKLYKLPNNNSVRSLHIAEDGRIYAGSFEEFGYFETDDKNQLIYHSLKNNVKNYEFSNDEIWTINEYEGKIYFQSFSSFFIYDGYNVEKGFSEQAPLYFFVLNDIFYAQFMSGGFCRLDDGKFIELISRDRLNDDNVVAVLPYDDKLILVTALNGLYLYHNGEIKPWNNPVSELLKKNIANRATMTKDSVYVIGTISGGVIAMNKQGDLLWHINRENGLNNNTVLGLYIDHMDNLWVALDNGMANIRISFPLYVYEPSEVQIGMVHDMAIKKGKVYLATNQGIYVYSPENLFPRLIPGSEEQTWCIEDIDNQLIAGHNKGTLLIEDEKAIPVSGPGGGTALRKGIIHGKEVLLQMSYSSLSVFLKDNNGRWSFSHNVEGFNNLIKSFEIDPAGNIWASHMHKGLYRISLNETLQKVKDIQYIGKLDESGQEGKINVMKLRGRIVLTDGNQFYTYEDLSNTIVPYSILNNDFKELGDTYRIVPLHNDMFWFIRDTEYVLLNYERERYILKLRIPFALFKNPPIEDRGNVYIASDGTSYFCLNGGIAIYKSAILQDRDTPDISLRLSSVKAYDRQNNKSYLLPCKSSDELPKVSLNYQSNNIVFELSYPDYNRFYSKIKYKLEGFDNKWSEASSDFSKSYSNLSFGDYKFIAVVENSSGEELSALSYSFNVKRPFYRSIPALVLYFILGAFLIFISIKKYIDRIIAQEKKQQEIERKKQEEQLKAQEQTIVKLKNEKLESELTFKSKELASATMTIINYNELLTDLKKEIQALQSSGSHPRKSFQKLINKINNNLSREDEWQIFQANFDRIHENFFRKLKEKYPDLTSSDLRMCALLRLNMPTKDMARMFNLSVRGVEAARYRLRKKLNLPEGKSLFDFMIYFK